MRAEEHGVDFGVTTDGGKVSPLKSLAVGSEVCFAILVDEDVLLSYWIFLLSMNLS